MKSITLEVQINRHWLTALIDSGAARNHASLAAVNKYELL